MTRMLDILEDYCRIRDYCYFRIDGNTTGEDRDAQIEKFNTDVKLVHRIFLLSTRAGGLGINLATADTVILFDSDWNPQVDLQAMDRAHRIGQLRPVNVYRLVTENSIEEKIVERANLKLQLDSAVIQQGRLTDRQLTKKELVKMIQFGANAVFKASTDLDDLDCILKRGEARTSELNDEMSKHVKRSVLDFTSDGAMNVYEFEGQNYSETRKQADKEAWQKLSMESLEVDNKRKSRAIIKTKSDIKPLRDKVQVPKNLRLPLIMDFQFYDRVKLEELQNKILSFQKELARREEQGAATEEFASQTLDGLTEAEHTERTLLLSQGFQDWTKKDLHVGNRY
eukprot:Platyproteum_vivax@DN6471_c0_g1_i2.p2